MNRGCVLIGLAIGSAASLVAGIVVVRRRRRRVIATVIPLAPKAVERSLRTGPARAHAVQ